MRFAGYGMLTIVLSVGAGCGLDSLDGLIRQLRGANPRADEGDVHIKTPGPAPWGGVPDPNQLPPMRLVLRADDNGNVVSMRLNEKGFARGDFGALRGYIIGILGDKRGPNSIQATAEIQLDFDYSVRYRHAMGAITAVSGYVDEEDKVVRLIERFKFAPPKKEVLAQPTEADLAERVSPPTSELARSPVPPWEETILLELTKSGNIILHGETLKMDEMARRMTKEVQKLHSMGMTAGESTVIIRADKDCPIGKIQQLIETCQRERYERFALRARLKQVY